MRIITPVGLSLFSNFFDSRKGKNNGLKDEYDELKKEQACKYEKEKDTIEPLKKELNKFVQSDNASAEITSTIKITEKFPENEFSVSLLPSDSVLSLLAAELIKESKVLENQCSKITKVTVEDFISGLQVDDEQEFVQKGMTNLIEKISEFINNQQGNLLINITGGYKATVPYLTLMGQIYNISLYYIFEETSETNSQLIQIPQAPIHFDFTLCDEYYDVLKLLKGEKSLPELQQELSKNRKLTEKDIEKLKGADHIEEQNEKFSLALMGELIINAYENIRSKGFRNDYSILRSKLIELKVFEYCVQKKYPNAKIIEHDKQFKDKKDKKPTLESDIFVELDDEIISVEVKPSARFREIENNFDKEKFYYLCEQYSEKKIILEFILYSYSEMNSIVYDKIKTLHSKYCGHFNLIKWYKIENLDKYKKDSHWKLTDNDITEITL